MGFASREDLQNLYLSGTFRKAITIAFPEISGSPNYPPEALVTGTDGTVIGECWTIDLEQLVAFGEAEQANTGRFNPNLPVVKRALDTMRAVREDVKTMEQRITAMPSAQIIHFPGLRT
ncbi:MAG: hypothetical protein WC043_02415 [Pseudobdellovibrionaceae bacterium]